MATEKVCFLPPTRAKLPSKNTENRLILRIHIIICPILIIIILIILIIICPMTFR